MDSVFKLSLDRFFDFCNQCQVVADANNFGDALLERCFEILYLGRLEPDRMFFFFAVRSVDISQIPIHACIDPNIQTESSDTLDH